jgi:hypothetical protein
MKSLWLAFLMGVSCLVYEAYALTSSPVNVPITIVTPTASLSADSTSITSGSSTTLRWSSTNATSCAGTGFATGNATSGSVSTGTLTTTTTYSVICSGSAPASVTVAVGGGGSVACDSGPNINSTPTPAQNAGFTHCALNADFTSATYSNPATFVDNCGATTQFRWYWDQNLSATPMNCSDITMVPDGALSQVLLLTLPVAEYQAGLNGGAHGGMLDFPGVSYDASLPCNAPCFPNEVYIQYTYRTSAVSWDQAGAGGNAHMDTFWVGRGIRPDGTYTANQWAEFDFAETTGNGRSASPNFGGGDGGECASGANCGYITWFTMDLTQYHTLGILVTSDGSTSYYKCTFLDGTLLSGGGGPYLNSPTACSNLLNAYTDPTVYSQHDNAIAFQMNSFGEPPTQALQYWIKNVQIWECAGWKTGQCNGSALYGPDANGLAYWH